MANKVTAVAFDEAERDALRDINDTKRISALVKPLTEEIRSVSKNIAALARTEWVSPEALENASRDVETLRGHVSTMPDTEEKNELLMELEHVGEVIQGALNLG